LPPSRLAAGGAWRLAGLVLLVLIVAALGRFSIVYRYISTARNWDLLLMFGMRWLAQSDPALSGRHSIA